MPGLRNHQPLISREVDRVFLRVSYGKSCPFLCYGKYFVQKGSLQTIKKAETFASAFLKSIKELKDAEMAEVRVAAQLRLVALDLEYQSRLFSSGR